MVWPKIVNNIKKIFSQPGKKEWLDKLVKNIEERRYNYDTLPFKIVDIKEKGFLAKVAGLYAFIPFNHMPWKYSDFDSWKIVYPKILDKWFLCKVYQVRKNPLSIIINGEVPQFKQADQRIGEEYTGLVIKKSKYGAFIDIGYHFDWKCGSLVGLLHKTQFGTERTLADCVTGQAIQTTYLGLNENGQLVFSNCTEKTDWYLGKHKNC